MTILKKSRHAGRFLMGAMKLCALLSLGVACRPAAAAALPPAGGVSENFGVCLPVHYRPGELRMIAAAGFRWLRQDFSWQATEERPGHYDFSAYHTMLRALSRYHMRAIWILGYGNPLYGGEGPYHTPVTPAARRAFCRWVAAAVRQFRGHGIVWEMWNEPNGTFTPKPWAAPPRTKAYIKLALAVGKTIRRLAPHELYIGPATSGVDVPFLRQCFRAELLRYFDAVSVHPYRPEGPESNYAGPKPGSAGYRTNVSQEYRSLEALIARHAPVGSHIPVVCGEWGYSSLWKGHRGYHDGRQARMLARIFLVNLSQRIPLTIWYEYNDGPNPTDPEHHFGLVHVAYHPGQSEVHSPKLSYLAAKTLLRQLHDCRFVRRVKVGVPNDWVLLFHGRKGSRLAVWKTGGKSATVRVPLKPGRWRLTNETGTRMRRVVVPPGGRGIRLTISRDPEYLARQHWNSVPSAP